MKKASTGFSQNQKRNSSSFSNKLFSIITAFVLLFSSVMPAFAATDTWTGATSAFFNASNWSGSHNPPQSGDALVFTSETGVGGLTLDNDFLSFAFSGITFDAGAAAFIIQDQTFTLFGNIVNNSTSLETISVNIGDAIILNGNDRTFQTSTTGGLAVSSIIDTSGNRLIANAAASSTIILSGNIIGAGGLTKSGDGTLTLSGAANTYSGGTILNAGTLNINSTTALGATAGSFTINGGTIDNTSGAGLTNANDNAITLGGNFAFSTSSGTSNNNLSLGAGAVSNSGNRIITLNGTGTLMFAGVMTNTAGAANTLTVNNGVGTSAATGIDFGGYELSNGAADYIDIINGSGTVRINGAVTNGGTSTASGLIYSGSGTLTLSGNNTYDGLTTAGAGTLVLSGDNSGAAGGVTLASGATLKIGNATALGSGTLTLNGGTIDTSGGAQTLTTNNAQTWGGNFIFTGTNDLDLGTGAVTMSANRQVTVSASTLTVGGVIGGGAVGLTKTGAGTLTLNNTNTYTGVTAINAGTLALGATQTTTTFNFTGDALLTIANTKNITGAITTGTSNQGTFEVLGTSTLTGSIGTSSELLKLVQIDNGATLNLADGFNVYAKDIDGGAADKGTLNFVGTSIVSATDGLGHTNGLLAVNFTGAGKTVTLASNIKAVTTTLSGGTLDIGSNQLSFTGAYDQQTSTTLSIDIVNTTTAGKITASGTGKTSGTSTISIDVPSGLYIQGGTTYTVLAAGGDAGLTAPLTTTNSNVLTWASAVSGNNVTVTAVRSNGYNKLSTNNNNENAVGAALERAGQNGVTGDMLNVLNTLDSMGSSQEITNAIATMTPDVSSGAAKVSRVMTGNSFRMISNRLGGVRSGPSVSGVSSGDMLAGTGFWIQGIGSNMKQDERKGIQGFSANTWGTTLGVDKMIDRHVRVGFAGSYGWAGVHSKQPGSPSDNINSYQATVYGSYDSLDLCKAREKGKNSREAVRNQGERSWYVDGMLAFTQNNYDSRREIWLTPSSQRVAKADHYGQQYSTNFETGYTFIFEETKSLEITPFASIGYNYLYMNSYKEKGADALNLSVQGKGFSQLEQGLGTKFAYPVISEKMGTFIPSAKAVWLYDYIADRFETTAYFSGGGGSFDTVGAQPARNGMLFGAELAFLNKGNLTVTGNWDIELRDQFMANTYYGTVRYDF